MNMDCEMSCDEKVVKLLGEESKKIYSYTLLEEVSGGEWKRYRGGSICALPVSYTHLGHWNFKSGHWNSKNGH